MKIFRKNRKENFRKNRKENFLGGCLVREKGGKKNW